MAENAYSGGLISTSRTSVLAHLVAHAVAERERWILWAPVCIAVGIGFYFGLSGEPPATVGLFFSFLFALGAFAVRNHLPVLPLLLLALALAALGFAAAQYRVASVAAPVLAKPYGPSQVVGRVIQIDNRPNGQRVTLDRLSLRGVPAAETPHRIRVVLNRSDKVRIGDGIDVFARLSPPKPPVAPGAYDFQRSAWFRSLGATGFALGKARPALLPPGGEGVAHPRLFLEGLRQTIAERIHAVLPGLAGAVAVALMTGDRSGIPQDSLEAMRDSGLAHLLAISGLHLGLVAASLFFGFRALLALSERLTLRRPIKKYAAAAALIGSFGYLLLAGAPVPTQRAFLMTSLVLLAVLVDRAAISMRLVAWAAITILLVAPESLLGASFQLSFAAVVALVAFYENMRGGLPKLRGWVGHGPFGRILLYGAGVAATTVIASLATGIVGLHHFGRIAVYGLPANMVAVPLTALWIMPWAVMAAVMMPFGMEAGPLLMMGLGIDGVLWVAEGISGWPGAVRHVETLPLTGLVLAALGGLWLCLWRRNWRFLGVAGLLAGLATVPLSRPPDVLVSSDGKLMAVRMADGRLSLSERRRERYSAERWLEMAGQGGGLYWPSSGSSEDGRLRCGGLGCIYRGEIRTVALVRNGLALEEDCRMADLVVSTVPVRGRCPTPKLVIDRFDLWREGATAIWLEQDKITVKTVAESQGARPWSSYASRQWRDRAKGGQ